MKGNFTVYRDDRYALGREDGCPFIEINGERYSLSCHPYEPCLYITDKNGSLTAVHNAFDPSQVLRAFSEGMTITSITGMEYDAKDFCRMVEYAEGTYNIQIDEAGKVFGTRAKKKNPEPENKKNTNTDKIHEIAVSNAKRFRPEEELIVKDDPFYDLIEKYPDSVVDFCIVKDESLSSGRNNHWYALVRASRWLFVDDDEAVWQFDAGKADARKISVGELFAPVDRGGKLNYRGAFLNPPYGNGYKDADFDKINAALFPNGTDSLEIYEWTTNWSEYFDEGNEWWGSLCLTVYDKSLNRFAVIMASATD